MISQTFKNIVLDGQDYDEINERVEAYANRVYGGELPGRQREILKEMLIRERKEGIFEARDYVYGQDEGEAPKGAQW